MTKIVGMKKIEEACEILNQLGFPPDQSNLRSGLTLLALADLKPRSRWRSAASPLRGITEMMDYFEKHYHKKYAPNSRETVRRKTIHQFLDAGLIVQNPDDPKRAVNSAFTVYQLIPEAVELLKSFGSPRWNEIRDSYLSKKPALKKIYAQQRKMNRIPVRLTNGSKIKLSPGGQNVLVKKVIDEFLPRFAPGCKVIYIGDTEEKWAYFDDVAFEGLGLKFDTHGKFPDVIAHYTDKDWLLLIEAVTSHGPVDPKRHIELKNLFAASTAGLVFVTTFLDHKTLQGYLRSIAWETEVWVAKKPGHMIHFDGKRFLGPYPD